jgi:hypothetical protein
MYVCLLLPALPHDGSRVACLKARNKHRSGPGAPPLRYARPRPPPHSIGKTVIERPNGRTFGVFFLHTYMTVLTYWYNWLVSYEIGIILVVLRYLYCGFTMCNDKVSNVLICSSNANIHVFVHEDLFEIYLSMLKFFIIHTVLSFKHCSVLDTLHSPHHIALFCSLYFI